MKTPLPTQQEIEELVSFLPKLYVKNFKPIKRWHGGTKNQDGIFTFPWPKYDEIVVEFFGAASAECWADYTYCPEKAFQMLENEDAVKTADLAQIKTMLTYCVRGERFCAGHWGAMIEGGYILRLLQRLTEISLESYRRKL